MTVGSPRRGKCLELAAAKLRKPPPPPPSAPLGGRLGRLSAELVGVVASFLPAVEGGGALGCMPLDSRRLFLPATTLARLARPVGRALAGRDRDVCVLALAQDRLRSWGRAYARPSGECPVSFKRTTPACQRRELDIPRRRRRGHELDRP